MRLGLLLLLLVACAMPPPPPDPADVRREADLAFLREKYGYEPGAMPRDRRALADLLQREDRMGALRRAETIEFADDLARLLGYRFRPADAAALAAAPGGPPGRALRDPAVRKLLAGLNVAGLLDDHAGRRVLGLDPRRADALVALAADPAAPRRIDSLAGLLPYRFRPEDAPGLILDRVLSADDAAWLTALLSDLDTEFRPRWWPQVEILLGARSAVDGLRELAAGSEVSLRGPGALLVLSRLTRDARPLLDADIERFRALANRAEWPNSSDFLQLVPLSRVEGLPELVGDLARRWDYRFDPADGPALLRVLEAGVPDVDLPRWVERDRLPLTHPGALLSGEPATAFADPNDLRFMESLARSRPELTERRRATLELRLEKRLAGLPHCYRAGAPYSESADEVPALSTPDLLKALLLLQELERPEVIRQLVAWAMEDVADRETELGGYVRLGEDGRLRFELTGRAAGRDDRLHLPPDPEGAALDFHFHATDENESAWAGPSSGTPGTDLFRAEFHRIDGAVITKLAGERINVDIYVSTKRALDLGVYGR